jgi:hypothetical protein
MAQGPVSHAVMKIRMPTLLAPEPTMLSETTLWLFDMSMHIGDMPVHHEQL